MKSKSLSLLWIDARAAGTGATVEAGAVWAGPAVDLAAAGWLGAVADDAGAARQYDAVVYAAPDHDALAALAERADLPQAAFETAVVVVSGAADDETLEAALLGAGVQAIVPGDDPPQLMRALRHAVQRKAAERAARSAYATDLATGLPHSAQLIEHMNQLLALREREPVPMVLLVLRIQGYAEAAQRLGGEAGNILRRKVAVRLRSQLRASDVVAALGPDAFGVLLGRLEAKTDGQRVAAKLQRCLQQPVIVAGHPCSVWASVGMALYPDQGRDADTLLKRASAQAGSVAALGETGFAGATTREVASPAANDEKP